MPAPPCRVKQKIYTKKCCVWGCKNASLQNQSEDVEFYQLPSGNLYFLHKVMRREAWLAAIRSARPGGAFWEPKGSVLRICSEHFVGNKRSDDPRNVNYNPTLFPKVYSEIKVNKEEIMEKHNRLLERLNFRKEQMASPKKPKNFKVGDNASGAKAPAVSITELQRKRRLTYTRGTQIDFMEENEKEDSPQIFLCCRYCTIGSDKCDAEVQVYRPRNVTTARITVDPLTIDNDDPH